MQNFQLMKLCEFVRAPTVSDRAKFGVQISKDEAATPLLTVGLLFILGHLSRVHLATLKIHFAELRAKDITRYVVNNSRNEAASLARIPFLFA